MINTKVGLDDSYFLPLFYGILADWHDRFAVERFREGADVASIGRAPHS